MAITPNPVTATGAHGNSQAHRGLLIALVSLFFIWGGLTSLNDVLIPKLKGLFSLSYTEAMLTQFAFFMAYFLVSLPAGQLIARLGYLRGIVIGLAIMALGCIAFIPASGSGIYATFLVALFILATGITILQVAANPLIASMGSPSTASSRLTLAQAFNSLGTTIFPPIGGAIILGSLADIDPAKLPDSERTAFFARESAVIGTSYLAIAAVLALVAVFFWIRRRQLPQPAAPGANTAGSFALLRIPRLSGAVLCIFLYVGAEVAIGSMLINYLAQPRILAVTEQVAAGLIALYWGGAMVGRFIGSAVLRMFSPGLVLAGFALCAAALALLSGMSSGTLAAYALLSVGLMNSIMFPTIFSLGVDGLGERTPQGSGLLCMGIVGGAVIPPVFGMVADAASLAFALIVPILCYLVIAVYGWAVGKS
ncbi:MAG: sugar MFS transporter [Novosphingobium sp.]